MASLYCNAAVGQPPPPAILELDVDNVVEYVTDISDLSKIATNPGVMRGVPPKDFYSASAIGDILTVNGQPAKGTVTWRAENLSLTPVPNPGQAIADTARVSTRYHTFEILKADGTPVGTIMALGLGGGSAPPGAPLAVTGNNMAIVGGTGAFLGARGQFGGAPTARSPRGASVTEDPANRRLNGGGRPRWILHVIPMEWPEIVMASGGPVVFHADFTPVTSAKPAKAGEILIVQATGLGPTVPGVNPGQPFPTDAIQQVNSPVAVTVNGKDAELVNSIGWPGRLNTYRVDFRVPEGTAAGTAALQLTVAWIAGTSVNIPTQ